MLIALPNEDGSFTCTLFMPYDNHEYAFNDLDSDNKIDRFFKEVFPEMSDYYDLCSTLEDIRFMEYNRMCKEDLLSEDEIDFHWDDDFVWHHPSLANSLINYRKVRNYPTKMYSQDEFVGEFGYDNE